MDSVSVMFKGAGEEPSGVSSVIFLGIVSSNRLVLLGGVQITLSIGVALAFSMCKSLCGQALCGAKAGGFRWHRLKTRDPCGFRFTK